MADEALLARFADFAGGVDAPLALTTVAPAALTYTETRVAVPHVDGRIAGDVVDVTFAVHMQQLELAPAEDRLYSHYDPDQEHAQQREAYRQAVEDLGDNVPALYVLPMEQSITVGSETLPMYRVYHDPVIYYALRDAGRLRVHVRIPRVRNPGELLLLLLSLQQHMRPLSRLELADAARRLSEEPYKYSRAVIARHLARNDETSETPSEEYVSNLIGIARLPELVRGMVHRGDILFSHARLLSQRCEDNPDLCEQLACWVAQDKAKRQTVDSLQRVINLLLPPSGRPSARVVERDGKIAIDQDMPLKLVAPPRESAPALHYSYLMAARPQKIRQEAQRRTVAIVPNSDPDKVAVQVNALHALADDLGSYTRNVPVRDVEAILIGFLEATRRALAEAHALNEHGIVAPVVESTVQEA